VWLGFEVGRWDELSVCGEAKVGMDCLELERGCGRVCLRAWARVTQRFSTEGGEELCGMTKSRAAGWQLRADQ